MPTKTVSYCRKTPADRRHDLILAGIACLSKGGMSAFTIDKISKQANVSRGLINHHFRTKDELLVCIYADMTEYLVKKQPDTFPQQQLEMLIEENFDEKTLKKSYLRAWLAIWGEIATNPALRSLHERRYKKYKSRLTAAIRGIAKSRDVRINASDIARQLIALIDGLWLAYCLHADSFSLKVAKNNCYQFLNDNLGEIEFGNK